MDFEKISSEISLNAVKNRIFDFFGESPRKYWPWFLFFFAVLFSASIIFSLFLLLSLSSPEIEGPINFGTGTEIKINLPGFEKTIKTLDERKEEFDKALAEPLFGDPSR